MNPQNPVQQQLTPEQMQQLQAQQLQQQQVQAQQQAQFLTNQATQINNLQQMTPEQVQQFQAQMQAAQEPQILMPQQNQSQSAMNLGMAAINATAASPVSPNRENPSTTQSTLLISEIRDNVVIMKDGSFRAVIACKSINFDLMSENEREGVEYSYQSFLNSLKFTTQILIRSQRVDIGPYIERLSDIRRNNDNMLLGVLMDDYINFIEVLAQEANIMDKSFFIIIPYYTNSEDEKDLQQTKNFFKTFRRKTEVTRIERDVYEKALFELTNRVDSVISGLFQMNIHSVRLNTKELGELYYNFNNPDTAVREPLADFSNVATMYVKKGEKPENG